VSFYDTITVAAGWRDSYGGVHVTTPTTEQIQQGVSEALEEAKVRSGYGDRLLPFTLAQIRFIQDLVAGALARVLAGDVGK
jgi:hypothetical protein